MIFRAPHEKDFTIMNDKFLQDTDLSFEAKGIMAYMLTLPNDHNIDLEEIFTHGKIDKDQYWKAIKELREKEYLKRVFLESKTESGKYSLCGSRNDLYETQTILLLINETQTNPKVKSKTPAKLERKKRVHQIRDGSLPSNFMKE